MCNSFFFKIKLASGINKKTERDQVVYLIYRNHYIIGFNLHIILYMNNNNNNIHFKIKSIENKFYLLLLLFFLKITILMKFLFVFVVFKL